MRAIYAWTFGLLLIGGAASLAAEAVRPTPDSSLERIGRADSAVASWPSIPRRAAELMMGKYGAPQAISEDSLIWTRTAPWKRITVRRDSPGADPSAVLEQAVTYDVPLERQDAALALPGGVKWNPGLRELTVQGEFEERNFMAVNIADKVLSGRVSPREGREMHARALELARAGKSSPLTLGLTFTPPSGDAPPRP